LHMSRAWRLALIPFGLFFLYVPQGLRMLPPPEPGHFQLLAIDIGQGTAVLVRTRHHALLFDTGPRQGDNSNAGDRILLPLFQTLGIGSLDMLLISHEDTDHVGGAEPVLRRLPVARLVSSLAEHHALRSQPGHDGRPVPHTACVAGLSWTWDGVRFDILHPTGEDLAQRNAKPASVKPNAISCVLRVSTLGASPTASVLITGDIGKAEEAAILDRASSDAANAEQALRSTVLFAPHHGSKTSSSEAFLKAVSPRLIVIQAGRRNAYGHPAPVVIDRLNAMALPWVSTPDCGAYLWHSDEVAAQPDRASPVIGHCWRHEHHRYWQDLSGAAMPR
jgi:competence protein ComEC